MNRKYEFYCPGFLFAGDSAKRTAGEVVESSTRNHVASEKLKNQKKIFKNITGEMLFLMGSVLYCPQRSGTGAGERVN